MKIHQERPRRRRKERKMPNRNEELSDKMKRQSKKAIDAAKNPPAATVPDIYEIERKSLAEIQALRRKHPPTNIGGGDE